MSAASRIRWRSVVGVWRRHTLALLRVWKVAFTWFVIEPVVVLAAAAIGIGRLVGEVEGHGAYAAFVTPGIIMGNAMFHAIFEASWSAFERINQSVYDTVLTAPVTVAEIVLAELAFAVTRSLISIVALGSFATSFGWIPLSAAPGLLAVGIGTGLLFGGIGLLFAALSKSLHVLSLVFTLVATPLFFFSGSFFPIAVLPDWIEPVAWFAPLTPLVQMARACTEGAWTGEHTLWAVYTAAMVVVFAPLAVAALTRRLLK